MQFLITAPLFALIAVGFAAVRSGLVPKAAVQGIGQFVLYFAVPALIFRALTSAPLDQVFNPVFMAAYGGGAVAVLLLTLAVFRLAFKAPLAASGVNALGAAFSNVIFIGFPIAWQVFGEVPAAAFTMALLMDNIVMLPLALVIIEIGAGGGAAGLGGTLRGIAGRLARNPLMLAIAAGIVFSGLGWTLPDPVVRVIDMLADASPGAALFYVGGLLVGARLSGRLAAMGTVAALKLVVHPLLVVTLFALLPPVADHLRTTAIVFSTAPMLAIYPVIASRYGLAQEAASTLLIATATSFVTISVALTLML